MSFLPIAERWETTWIPSLEQWAPALAKTINTTWAAQQGKQRGPGELLGVNAFPSPLLSGKSPTHKQVKAMHLGPPPGLQDPEEGLASPASAPASSLPPPLAGILPCYKKWDTRGEGNKSTHSLLPSSLWAAQPSSQGQPRVLLELSFDWKGGRRSGMRAKTEPIKRQCCFMEASQNWERVGEGRKGWGGGPPAESERAVLARSARRVNVCAGENWVSMTTGLAG